MRLFVRQLHGITGGLTARDDADLVHLVAFRNAVCNDGMAGFMIANDLLIGLGHLAALLFRAHRHAGDSLFKPLHADDLFMRTRGEVRALVVHVF